MKKEHHDANVIIGLLIFAIYLLYIGLRKFIELF